MPTTIERMVLERGPLPVSNSPFPTKRPGFTEDKLSKHDAVSLFHPDVSRGAGEFSPGQGHEGVLYHEDHSKREVIEAYLDTNPQVPERNSAWTVAMKLESVCPTFADAAKRVALDRSDADSIRDIDAGQW